MDQTTWLLLAFLASTTTYVTLFRDVEDILGGIVGMFLWGLWALGATNVEIVRAGDTAILTQTESYPVLALFGAGMAAVMFLILLTGAATMLDPRGGNAELVDANRR